MIRGRRPRETSYSKVVKVIRSCETPQQMRMAEKMVYLFDKMYNNPEDYNALDAIYSHKCMELWDSIYATS